MQNETLWGTARRYIKLLCLKSPFYCNSHLLHFLEQELKSRQPWLPTISKSDLKLKQFESDYRGGHFHPPPNWSWYLTVIESDYRDDWFHPPPTEADI